MANVTRKRLTIWLDAETDNLSDVHTEDDMVMIEATDASTGDEFEVMICPALFDQVTDCIERIKARAS